MKNKARTTNTETRIAAYNCATYLMRVRTDEKWQCEGKSIIRSQCKGYVIGMKYQHNEATNQSQYNNLKKQYVQET